MEQHEALSVSAIKIRPTSEVFPGADDAEEFPLCVVFGDRACQFRSMADIKAMLDIVIRRATSAFLLARS